MRTLLLFPLIALIVAACGAPQHHDAASPPAASAARTLEVRNGWAAPTPGGVQVAAGYLTIVNGAGADDRLVSASSPRAAQIEVHEMSMDGAIMRMRPVAGGLAVPAGATVTLSPGGGLHLMFMGVTQPFAEGETIPVTLTFEHAGDVAVELRVRREGAH